MSEPKKIVVKLKVDQIGNVSNLVDSLLSGTVVPDLVFLELNSLEFPNRILDFPNDVRKYVMTHPKVKTFWGDEDPFEANDGYEVVYIEDGREISRDFIERNITFKPHEYLDMTMVSVFYDAGINELRKVATRKAVSCLLKQYHLPREMMFIELGFKGVFTFSKEDFPEQIEYIRIDGNDSHKYLFQKEHLWNIAAKRAKYEKLMFVDSDIAPLEDVDWFKQVYEALDKCLFT